MTDRIVKRMIRTDKRAYFDELSSQAEWDNRGDAAMEAGVKPLSRTHSVGCLPVKEIRKSVRQAL